MDLLVWPLIFFPALAIFLVCLWFLWTRFQKFYVVKKLSGGKAWRRRLIAAIPLVIACGFLAVDMLDVSIVLIYLVLFFLVCGGIGKIVEHFVKVPHRLYYVGIASLLLTAEFFVWGAFNAYNVQKTEYTLSSNKLKKDLTVAMFADSHLSTLLDGKKLEEYCDEIMKSKPDILVISGDFVDDSTTKDDMVEACEALGKLSIPVYYATGNHDPGYRDARGFSYAVMINEMKKNNITVLEDECLQIRDDVVLIGRRDKSSEKGEQPRKTYAELTKNIDKSKYSVVLDHQPNDYDAEAAGKADLVLSGHTHGGQMIPIIKIGEWIGKNDRTYGYERRGSTDFIVTSGIGDWAIKFKTGCISEYVIVRIKAA